MDLSADLSALSLQIGKNIKKFRLKLGITQGQACEKISCDKRFYQRVEAGKAGLTLRTLLRFSVGLGIPLQELIKIDEDVM